MASTRTWLIGSLYCLIAAPLLAATIVASLVFIAERDLRITMITLIIVLPSAYLMVGPQSFLAGMLTMKLARSLYNRGYTTGSVVVRLAATGACLGMLSVLLAHIVQVWLSNALLPKLKLDPVTVVISAVTGAAVAATVPAIISKSGAA